MEIKIKRLTHAPRRPRSPQKDLLGQEGTQVLSVIEYIANSRYQTIPAVFASEFMR